MKDSTMDISSLKVRKALSALDNNVSKTSLDKNTALSESNKKVHLVTGFSVVPLNVPVVI
jgi:hypothetical protein